MDETQAPSTEVVAEGTIVAESGAEQVETAPEAQEQAPPQPTEAEQRIASRFAALSRKEKGIRDRERQMQQQMNQLQQQLEALKAQESEVGKWKSTPDRLRREPLKVLEEAGLTIEQLTEIMMNGGRPTPEMQISDAEKKVQQRIEDLERKLVEKEEKEVNERYEATLRGFMNELTTFANDTPDYELIRANDAVDLVYQVIEQHHSETGEVLDNKSACDAVEEYLLEQAKKLVDREKVKKLIGASAPATPKAPGKSSPTLSNTQAAQVPTTGQRKLTNEESLLEAAKLIKWQD